jgi:hypothetical protein
VPRYLGKRHIAGISAPHVEFSDQGNTRRSAERLILVPPKSLFWSNWDQLRFIHCESYAFSTELASRISHGGRCV